MAQKKKAKAKKTKKATKKTTAKKKAVAKKTTKKKAAAKKVAKKKTVKKAAKKTAAKKKVEAKKTAKKATTKKATTKKTTKKSTTTPKAEPASKKKAAKKTAKKTTKPTKKASAATSVDDDDDDDEELTTLEKATKKLPPLAKRIKKKDLDQIRKNLLNRRAQLTGSLSYLESEHLGTNENANPTGGDEADKATSGATADISLRLAESESKELQDVVHALAKLDDGSFGICEMTGEEINVERLLYIPWARFSVKAQSMLEKRNFSAPTFPRY